MFLQKTILLITLSTCPLFAAKIPYEYVSYIKPDQILVQPLVGPGIIEVFDIVALLEPYQLEVHNPNNEVSGVIDIPSSIYQQIERDWDELTSAEPYSDDESMTTSLSVDQPSYEFFHYDPKYKEICVIDNVKNDVIFCPIDLILEKPYIQIDCAEGKLTLEVPSDIYQEICDDTLCKAAHHSKKVIKEHSFRIGSIYPWHLTPILEGKFGFKAKYGLFPRD